MKPNPVVEPRFELILLSYPHFGSIESAAELLYGSKDKNIMASLSSLPYTIGRTFNQTEVSALNRQLTDLKIGHTFKGLTPGAEDLTYTPDKPPSSNKAEVSSSKPSSSSSSITGLKLLWISLGIVVAIAGGIVAWKMRSALKPEISATISQARARIERLSRDVEYRRSRDFVWSKATLDLPLENQDGIRTFDESSAVIQYQEGTRVIVKPNSLLIVGAESNPSDETIRLEDGSISARLSSKQGQSEARLSILTKSGTLRVQAREGKEAAVETEVSGDHVRVAVTQGEVSLTPQAPGSSSITIAPMQQITATPTNISPPEAYTPRLGLYAPKNDAQVLVNPNTKTPVIFRWEDFGGSGTYRLTISSDPKQENVLVSQNTSQNEVTLTYLDSGTLYWSVSAQVRGITYKSSVWRLHVQEHGE